MPAVILENEQEVGEVEGIPPAGSVIAIVIGGHERLARVVRHRWTIPANQRGMCTAVIVRPKDVALADDGGPSEG